MPGHHHHHRCFSHKNVAIATQVISPSAIGGGRPRFRTLRETSDERSLFTTRPTLVKRFGPCILYVILAALAIGGTTAAVKGLQNVGTKSTKVSRIQKQPLVTQMTPPPPPYNIEEDFKAYQEEVRIEEEKRREEIKKDFFNIPNGNETFIFPIISKTNNEVTKEEKEIPLNGEVQEEETKEVEFKDPFKDSFHPLKEDQLNKEESKPELTTEAPPTLHPPPTLEATTPTSIKAEEFEIPVPHIDSNSGEESESRRVSFESFEDPEDQSESKTNEKTTSFELLSLKEKDKFLPLSDEDSGEEDSSETITKRPVFRATFKNEFITDIFDNTPSEAKGVPKVTVADNMYTTRSPLKINYPSATTTETPDLKHAGPVEAEKASGTSIKLKHYEKEKEQSPPPHKSDFEKDLEYLKEFQTNFEKIQNNLNNKQKQVEKNDLDTSHIQSTATPGTPTPLINNQINQPSPQEEFKYDFKDFNNVSPNTNSGEDKKFDASISSFPSPEQLLEGLKDIKIISLKSLGLEKFEDKSIPNGQEYNNNNDNNNANNFNNNNDFNTFKSNLDLKDFKFDSGSGNGDALNTASQNLNTASLQNFNTVTLPPQYSSTSGHEISSSSPATLEKRTSYDNNYNNFNYNFDHLLGQIKPITSSFGNPTSYGASLTVGLPPYRPPQQDQGNGIPSGTIPLDLSKSFIQVGNPPPPKDTTFTSSDLNPYITNHHYSPTSYHTGNNGGGNYDFNSASNLNYNSYGGQSPSYSFNSQNSQGSSSDPFSNYNTITGGIQLLNLLSGNIPKDLIPQASNNENNNFAVAHPPPSFNFQNSQPSQQFTVPQGPSISSQYTAQNTLGSNGVWAVPPQNNYGGHNFVQRDTGYADGNSPKQQPENQESDLQSSSNDVSVRFSTLIRPKPKVPPKIIEDPFSTRIVKFTTGMRGRPGENSAPALKSGFY